MEKVISLLEKHLRHTIHGLKVKPNYEMFREGIRESIVEDTLIGTISFNYLKKERDDRHHPLSRIKDRDYSYSYELYNGVYFVIEVYQSQNSKYYTIESSTTIENKMRIDSYPKLFDEKCKIQTDKERVYKRGDLISVIYNIVCELRSFYESEWKDFATNCSSPKILGAIRKALNEMNKGAVTLLSDGTIKGDLKEAMDYNFAKNNWKQYCQNYKNTKVLALMCNFLNELENSRSDYDKRREGYKNYSIDGIVETITTE